MQGVELQVGSSYRPLACTAGNNKVGRLLPRCRSLDALQLLVLDVGNTIHHAL